MPMSLTKGSTSLLLAAACLGGCSAHAQERRKLFIAPDSPELRYIGRFARGRVDDMPVMNVDTQGAEVQFIVEGPIAEVAVHLSQQITGPGGFYFDPATAPNGPPTKMLQTGKAGATKERHGAKTAHNKEALPEIVFRPRPELPNLSFSQMFTDMESESDEASENENAYASRMEPSGSQPHEFLAYVDGVPQVTANAGSPCRGCTFDTRLARNGTVQKHRLAANLGPGRHVIRLVKISEPEWSSLVPTPNWITVYGFMLDGGKVLPMTEPRRQRRIEFLGDSSMTGYCNLCSNQEEQLEGKRQGTFAKAWPALLCEALGAECHTMAYSGYGIARNCCDKQDVRIAHLWPRTVSTDPSSRWDFSSWVPHALIINLGTNDNLWRPMWKDNYPAFIEQYLELVVATSNTYGLDTEIFLSCGPLSHSEVLCPYVHEVVKEAKKRSIKAHYFDQMGYINGTYGPSCCWHPSVANSEAMAKDGVAFISKTLGWPQQ